MCKRMRDVWEEVRIALGADLGKRGGATPEGQLSRERGQS